MSFDATIQGKSLDLLTLIAVLGLDDPEVVYVRYAEPVGNAYQRTAHHMYDGAPPPLLSQPKACCLKCIMQKYSVLHTYEAGKMGVVEAVKAGQLVVYEVKVAEEGWRCPRCSSHVVLVNQQWQAVFDPQKT